ncbi:MAG: hypothetical protein FJX74_25200 [Armatimonadetes bacterium]|nr:hypothetical protein [Armatimonadota bacterium]
MPSSTLEMILKVTDKASGELKKIDGGLDGLKTGLQSVGVAMAAVSVATGAAVATWKSVVQPVIDYNKEILDASRATRMTTTDMSRIVQVADDFGIEMGTVTRALELATKNGFAPSVESIAQLADKARSLT